MVKKLLLGVGLVWCLVSLVQAEKAKTIEQCEKNIPASLKDRICELRQYKTIDSADMDKHMQCILEVVGFIDDTGDVQFQELLGLLKTVEPADDHVPNIKKCVAESAKVEYSKKANSFYTCILDTSSAAGFKKAVDYVELVRAGKLTVGAPYKSDVVKSLIAQIDDKLCT